MELFSTENKRVVFLEPFSGGETSGILLVEKQNLKVSGLLCLFNQKCLCPRLLIDDFVCVREFEVSPSCTEIDLPDSFLRSSDLACAVFDSDENVIVCGRALGKIENEMIERMKIAIEKPNQIEHFKKLLGEVLENETENENIVQKKVENETSFLDEVKTLLLEIFCVGLPDARLSRLIPNSKWVKIALENMSVVVGMVINKNKIDSIGLAVPVFQKNQKMDIVDNSFFFVPQNPNVPSGFGFWVVLQDSKTGKVVGLDK